jgi:hypothetical protein
VVAPPGESRSGNILELENFRNRATDPEFGNPVGSTMSMKPMHRALLVLVTALTSGCTVCVEGPRGACVQGYPIRRVIVYRAPAPAPFLAPPPWCQPPPPGVGMWVRHVTFRRIAVPSPVYAPQFESGPSSRFIPSVTTGARFENISVSEATYDAGNRRGNADVPLLPNP